MSDNPTVRDSMLDEFNKPLVANGIEETTNVSVEYPVNLPLCNSDRKCEWPIVLCNSIYSGLKFG